MSDEIKQGFRNARNGNYPVRRPRSLSPAPETLVQTAGVRARPPAGVQHQAVVAQAPAPPAPHVGVSARLSPRPAPTVRPHLSPSRPPFGIRKIRTPGPHLWPRAAAQLEQPEPRYPAPDRRRAGGQELYMQRPLSICQKRSASFHCRRARAASLFTAATIHGSRANAAPNARALAQAQHALKAARCPPPSSNP